jgi:hypothetical protein
MSSRPLKLASGLQSSVPGKKNEKESGVNFGRATGIREMIADSGNTPD